MKASKRKPTAEILTLLVGLAVLAAGLVTLLTPNFYGKMHPSVVPGSYGQDALALVGLPFLAWGLLSGRRGSLRGMIVWIGLLVFYFYGYALYTIGTMYTPLYPLYLAITALAGWAIVLTILRFDIREVAARRAAFPAVFTAVLFLLNTIFLGGAWLAQMFPAVQAVQPPPMYSVFVMDLGFAFPLLSVAAIGLLRGQDWSYAMGGPLLVKGLVTTTSLVTAEAIAAGMGRQTDPLPIMAMFALFAVASAVLLGVYFTRLAKR